MKHEHPSDDKGSHFQDFSLPVTLRSLFFRCESEYPNHFQALTIRADHHLRSRLTKNTFAEGQPVVHLEMALDAIYLQHFGDGSQEWDRIPLWQLRHELDREFQPEFTGR